jgi:hypothetical protein
MQELNDGMSWRRFNVLYNCLSSQSVTVELKSHKMTQLNSGTTNITTDKHLDKYLKQQFG